MSLFLQSRYAVKEKKSTLTFKQVSRSFRNKRKEDST